MFILSLWETMRWVFTFCFAVVSCIFCKNRATQINFINILLPPHYLTLSKKVQKHMQCSFMASRVSEVSAGLLQADDKTLMVKEIRVCCLPDCFKTKSNYPFPSAALFLYCFIFRVQLWVWCRFSKTTQPKLNKYISLNEQREFIGHDAWKMSEFLNWRTWSFWWLQLWIRRYKILNVNYKIRFNRNMHKIQNTHLVKCS